MIVIGITGPTGAGKTTVLNVLRDMGGAVADCDAVYHELLRTSAPLRAELRARFDEEGFCENGDLRREALGGIVFEDAGGLAGLNATTPPAAANTPSPPPCWWPTRRPTWPWAARASWAA